ncbi:MgtC/SapB family protein [Paenibacillus cisolokensis]|jgi:putative Mg2+ transporter-C (MgtC) family protein|uniref:MgtC/SapB family protein n=1 Tax=Paenibacillus cisolokensis TaxID=1658519 RepID=UPI003D27F50D
MEWLDENLWLKLGLSALLGLIIGLERELKSKPLGLKTSPVIAIISCLLTIVSIESAYLSPGSDAVRIQMDPLRLAAQIVSGIGFLGAGVILKRGNDHISGLTTAAMIWGAAGVGIAVGAGFYYEAIIVTALLMITVELLPLLLSKPLRLMKKEHLIKVTISDKSSIEPILDRLKAEKIEISQCRIKAIKEESMSLLEVRTRVNVKITITDLYKMISNMDDVVGVEIMN